MKNRTEQRTRQFALLGLTVAKNLWDGGEEHCFPRGFLAGDEVLEEIAFPESLVLDLETERLLDYLLSRK